jgi:hypothetical protein
LRELLHAPTPNTREGLQHATRAMGELDRVIKADERREAEMVEVSRTMDTRQREKLQAWAMTPQTGTNRHGEPPEREALRKVAHLYRSGLPEPLQLGDLAHGRLTAREALELLDLVQRAFRGGAEFGAKDIPRKDQLLEKACGATPGVVAEFSETHENINGASVSKADWEAYRQAKAECKVAEAKLYAARNKLPPAVRGHDF